MSKSSLWQCISFDPECKIYKYMPWVLFYFKVRMLTGLDVKYVNKNLIYVKQRKMKKSILHIFPESLLKWFVLAILISLKQGSYI